MITLTYGLGVGLAALAGVLMLAYVLFGGMVATTWVQIIKALLLVAAGLAIGAAMSALTAALLRRVFVDFGGGVVPSLGLAAVALLGVGLVAGLIPALRAASVDPVKALRTE